MASFSVSNLNEYLGKVIVSSFNDFLGENMDTILNLPNRYEEWSAGLRERLQNDFLQFGLSLTQLYINSITPPPEVQRALDDKTKLGMFDDMNKLMQLKAATAMEKAAENQGSAGESMGMGVGFMMPALMAQAMQQMSRQPDPGTSPKGLTCPKCGQAIHERDSFCASCGHHLLVFEKCAACGKNLSPGSRFCPSCGKPVNDTPKPVTCPTCGQENLPSATFCNHCGERIKFA